MKLFKRILSTICALTMISSLSVFTVANAEGEPVISTEVVDYDNTTGIGKLEVSITDVDTYCAANAIQGFEVHLEMNSEVFDTTYYAKGTVLNAPYKKNNIKMDGKAWIDVTTGEACGLFTPGVYDSTKGELVTTGAQMLFIEASDLFYINFKVLDPTKDATIGVSNCIINGLDLNSGEAVETKQAAGGIVADDVTIPGTGSGKDDDDEPTITQGKAEYADNDHAVWAWSEVASATGNALKVNATINGTEKTNTFAIPELETTTVKVGIIVQYDPTDISGVTINSMEVVTAE